MRHYAIAGIDITDPAWVGDYVANVTPMVESHGGRYLARTANIELLEGKRSVPQLILIIEWPSKEAALGFYDSAEYEPYRRRRIAGSRGDFMLVSGDDVNRVAHIGD